MKLHSSKQLAIFESQPNVIGFNEWFLKNQKRNNSEWSFEWDGTIEHGSRIADKQCDRLLDAYKKFNVTPQMIFKPMPQH